MKKADCVDMFINFRVNIQLLRIEKGLSANDLSTKLGFAIRRISNLEQTHKPTVEELTIICSFFCVSTEDILHIKATIKF